MKAKPARIQSPSSINIYRQCPRKYFYQYIQKIKTKTNIHLIRGSLAHKVLEDFYDINLDDDELTGDKFIVHINQLFAEEWKANLPELNKLDMTEDKLMFYYEETKNMINLWINFFLKRLIPIYNETKNLKKAFTLLTPRKEVLYQSSEYGVRGYIDVIEEFADGVKLIDYKTSKKAHISDDYKLQLAIYALMYEEKHNILPSGVGILFLKYADQQVIPVTKELIDFAKLECELIHINTQSKSIVDYPKKVTPLCKWSTGQCDFYDICFNKSPFDKFTKNTNYDSSSKKNWQNLSDFSSNKPL